MHKSSEAQKHNIRSILVEKPAQRGAPLGKWGHLEPGATGASSFLRAQVRPGGLRGRLQLAGLHVLPGGDAVSDLVLDGADLGADLGSRAAGPTRDVRSPNRRLVFRGTGVGGKPEEMRPFQVVCGTGALR